MSQTNLLLEQIVRLLQDLPKEIMNENMKKQKEYDAEQEANFKRGMTEFKERVLELQSQIQAADTAEDDSDEDSGVEK